MAPEVANGRYGKAIDIYALGIILYEMLTGRVPFEGESVGEVLMKHLTARPDLSGLAEPFRSVVAKALEKDPQRRFASVAEMAAALPRPASSAATAGIGVGAVGQSVGSPSPRGADMAEAVIRAEAADDEPILCAVREKYGELRRAWNTANLPLPIKVLIIVLLAFLLVQHAPLVIGVAISACVLYGGYRLTRAIVLAIQSPRRLAPTVGHPAPLPMAARAEPAPRQPPVVRAVVAQPVPAANPMGNGRCGNEQALPLMVKSFRQRFTELVGSLLFGSLVAAVAAGAMLLIGCYRGNVPTIEQAAWLVLAAVAGTWAVLVPTKFWEHREGDAALRRFTMMIVGAGLGLLAWFIADSLLVSLPRAEAMQLHNYQLSGVFYGPDGTAMPMAYIASFATVFLLIRWWKQTDPLRHTRLSLWSLACTVLVAAVAAGLWQFPQLWLPMAAGSVSIAVQMASPWLEPGKRHKRMLNHG
jgi:hypothetical protein